MRISTHASLAGRDAIINTVRAAIDAAFQPTRPLRDATQAYAMSEGIKKFQPTRPLRDATVIPHGDVIGRVISTHASLAGRDNCAKLMLLCM